MSRVWLKSCSVLAPACIVLVFLLRAHLIAKERLYWQLAQGDRSLPNDQSMKVLFVGNSFIHYNGGAEKVVAALLEEQLGTTVYARRYAPGGYTWEQHLADAADPSRLLHSLLGPGGEKPWDCVVFQEQSQAPALGGKESLDSLRALEGLVQLARSRGARIMLLMTWGYKEGDPAHHRAIFPDYHAMQERLTNGYLSFAAKLQKALNTSAAVAPAGLAWQEVYRLSRSAAAMGLPAGRATFYDLYYKDGIHPSIYGTYLEACVIASSVSGCKTSGMNSDPLGLGSAWRGFLQQVADRVVFDDERVQPGLLLGSPGCASVANEKATGEAVP